MKNLDEIFPRRKMTVTRLPIALHKQILKLYKTDSMEYQYAVHFVSKILLHYMYNKLPFTEPKPIPKSYYDKVLSSCKCIWKDLRDTLFFKTRNHSTYKGRSSSYILKPDLVQGDWIVVNYYQSLHQDSIEQGKINTGDPLYRNLKKVFEYTSINYKKKNSDQTKNKYKNKIKSEIRNNNMTYIPKKDSKEIEIPEKDLDIFSEQLATLKLERNLIETLKFKNGNWRANRNDTNKRLDTNFTNMSKDFKCHIKINGHPLKQIDISNSQPCILANILLYFKEHYLPTLNEYYETRDIGKILTHIPDEIINHPLSKGYENLQIPTSMGGGIPVGRSLPKVAGRIHPLFLYLIMWGFESIEELSLLINSPDFELFCKNGVDGSLYEYIFDTLSLQDRDEAKVSTYKFLFGYSEDEGFKNVFPSVSHIVYQFKQWLFRLEWCLHKADKRKYKNRFGNFSWKSGQNKFCILLQRIESEIVIDRIYVDLVMQYNCLTIHDSFLYYQDDVPELVIDRLHSYLPYGFEYAIT